MNYADIKEIDIQDGDGVRVSIYVSGCHFHCKECHNPEAWDFNYGKEFTEKEQFIIKKRFGLMDDQIKYTLQDVANELHVTHERVRQIEHKALRKFRKPQYARLLKDFME